MTTTASTTATSRWGGGTCPFATGWRMVMMWWFVVSDGLLFAGFLAAYGYARLAASAWPDTAQVVSPLLLTIMTLVLFASGACMARAADAAKRAAWPEAIRAVTVTGILGALFLGLQANEWRHVIAAGGRLDSNPWGDPAFGAYFFLITGFHGLHVFTGVVVLAATARRIATRRATAVGLEMAALYWHFVELVWVFIFTLFYLI
ncbi:MAG: heme-copper oxidase subunit III [Vicinamibacterales bacterium]